MARNSVSDALQRAIDRLQIQDVFMQRCQAWLADEFDPKYSEEAGDLQLLLRHVVSRSEVLAANTDADESLHLFRVYIDLGARWVAPEAEIPAAGTEDVADEDTRALIEAVFVAEYRFTETPGEEALAEFALQNASFHIWPYWREYLTNQCARMNLPKLALPIVQFAANRDALSTAKLSKG